MSVRNMLKVMLSLLLAMMIAATADTHAARVDQSPASVSAAGKLNDRIPYLLCQRICIGVCVCDRRPIEFAECTCNKPGDSTDSNKPAALLHTSEDDNVPKKVAAVADRLEQSLASVTEKAHELYEKLALLAGPVPKRTGGDDKKMVLWTTSKMEAIPYKECISTCESCACTLIYPPEAATCICLTPKPQAADGKAVAK